jgi:transposase
MENTEKRPKRRGTAQQAVLPVELQRVNLNAAGIDVGADSYFVAVPEGRDEALVKKFGVFTRDMVELGDWLEQCGVTAVAMESTGVYWIPLYEYLERRGFEVKLVDARRVKNVPGRKSDVLDCQWIQYLHMMGLLDAAFRPSDEICTLRGYMRQREMLVECYTMHVQHMQKALTQMNLRLPNVVSDITGVTGMKIIKAILAGERDPHVLSGYREPQCRKSREAIALALEGNYRDEHLLALKQATELYEFYQQKILECEKALLAALQQRASHTDKEPPPSNKPLRAKDRVRAGVDVRRELYRQTGVDLFQISGLGADTLLTVTSEVGLDMTPWKSEKNFGSWLGLCPGTKISGGKVLSNRSKRSRNRAAKAFRMAASTLRNSQTALGAFYRRIKSRVGAAKAITATAHKIAKIYYRLLKYGEAYTELGAEAYEMQYQERRLKALQKQATKFGYTLTLTPV